jgi:hypothetical protein
LQAGFEFIKFLKEEISMDSSEKDAGQKNGKSWAGVAKWIVLGVVLLFFLFLFRGQIGRILDRTTGLTISEKGVEIKTATTPLGTTTVSNAPVKADSSIAEGIQGSNYVNQLYRFQIRWPSNGKWSASDTTGKALHRQLGLSHTVDIPIVIMRNELVGSFRPNVNVVVESVGNVSIRQYMDSSVQSMQQLGWTILSSNVDESTQGGLIVFLNISSGNNIYQFQRILMSSGRAYVVTASQLPPDNLLSQQLRDELRNILNSFQLII